jgi:hypothetical protein
MATFGYNEENEIDPAILREMHKNIARRDAEERARGPKPRSEDPEMVEAAAKVVEFLETGALGKFEWIGSDVYRATPEGGQGSDVEFFLRQTKAGRVKIGCRVSLHRDLLMFGMPMDSDDALEAANGYTWVGRIVGIIGSSDIAADVTVSQRH